jgi:hypothetical protein
VAPELPHAAFDEALTSLVRLYLRSLGPATRRDLGYFFGAGLGVVDAAVTGLGEEVVRLPGPEGEEYLELAEPPADGGVELGPRLLPEFDALLVGFHGSHRTRFLTADQLGVVWAKVNGQFAPSVLHRGRIVATWRTLVRGARASLEVTMLPRCARLAEDELDGPVAALSRVLALPVAEVRVLA